MVTAEDIAREVEQAARALGVWWVDGDAPHPIAGQWTLSRLAWTANDYEVKRWLDPGQDQARWEPCFIDWTVAALILLGHRRGLRVDIGECSACRERGSNRGLALWEWMQRQRGYQFPLTWPDEVGEWQMADVPDRWPGRRVVEYRNDWEVISRPCPLCSIDGQPTGRHTLAWERAIIDAMPSDKTGLTPAVRASSSSHYLASFDGDPATRTALTILAHRLADPEHAAVFGDWLAERRDPTAFPAPRDGLAALLHAWLAGTCQACGGSGRVSAETGQPLAAGGTWWADDIGGCQACHGHGVTLGRFDDQIVAMLREISQATEQDASEAAQ